MSTIIIVSILIPDRSICPMQEIVNLLLNHIARLDFVYDASISSSRKSIFQTSQKTCMLDLVIKTSEGKNLLDDIIAIAETINSIIPHHLCVIDEIRAVKL